MQQQDKKERILVRTSWISTIGNAVLAASKVFIGLWAGSLAVLGDGIDSTTDVIISIVMIFTARIMQRPPDKKHPYGYDKAEGIATKILSLIIFYAGMQMVISSVERMISSTHMQMPGIFTIYITLFSILCKIGLSWYQYRQGKNINSSMLIANAVNMRNDVFISVGVLVGLAFTFLLQMPILDSVTGLLIGIFIVKSSIGIFLDTSVELMDGVKDVSVYNKIFEAVERVQGASNPHRVRSRQIGNLYMIALDVESDGNITLNEAHEIANAVEQSIHETVADVYDIVVHVEPYHVHRDENHAEERFGVSEQEEKF